MHFDEAFAAAQPVVFGLLKMFDFLQAHKNNAVFIYFTACKALAEQYSLSDVYDLKNY